MLRLTTLFVLSGLSAAHAAQGWLTQVEDDVFSESQTATMIGVTPGGDGVYLGCDADRKLEFSIIGKSKVKADGVPGELVAKIDGGEPMRFEAVSYSHNDEYMGFRSTDQEAIKTLINAIENARKSALFGLQIPVVDAKSSINPGIRGSTKAAFNFKKVCFE